MATATGLGVALQGFWTITYHYDRHFFYPTQRGSIAFHILAIEFIVDACFLFQLGLMAVESETWIELT